MRSAKLFLALAALSLHAAAQDVDVAHLQKAKKLDWSGSLSAGSTFYGVSGIPERSSPFGWNLSGAVNLRILETWDLPFTFTVNRFGNAVTKPMYQFGISPRYSWATLHLGHRNLSFNPYTLAGHTFFGAGAELTPGKFRFGAMYGRLRPAVELDTATGALAVPSFKRIGYGVKLGYGTTADFIDVILFKAKDDSSSIRGWKDKAITEKSSSQPLTPAANLAMGISAGATIFKKIRLNGDIGISAYNRDVRDTVLVSDIGVFKVTESTNITWAGKVGLGYSWKTFALRADYERVLPDYLSMGAYFFNNDFENITLSPTGSLWQGKAAFSGSMGVQRNNILGDRASSTKRLIGNANIMIAPSPAWGVNINYNNFSVNQTAGTVPVNDSFRLRQVSRTAGISPYYNITRDSVMSHSFNLNANMQNVIDRNIVTKQYGDMKTATLSLNHTTSYTRSARSINSGLNYNRIVSAGFTNTQAGATLGYGQAFLKDRMTASANLNYSLSSVNSSPDGNIINFTLTGAYIAGKRNTFSGSLSLIRSSSKTFASYTETLGALNYTLLLK